MPRHHSSPFVSPSPSASAPASTSVYSSRQSRAVSGAFSVDAPEHEKVIAERARKRGLPVCAGHELTGTYGLETRTISAAVNASMPKSPPSTPTINPTCTT